MGAPNLCKLSPRVTGIKLKSCHKTLSTGSHLAPLLLDSCNFPLLPQLLHPSSLPVAAVIPPSFLPPPLSWGVPFFRIHHTGRVSKGFQTEDGE